VIRSTVGIGTLLEAGIGDTIRVSLTGDPAREVGAGWEILSALDIRRRGPELIACPTCGRCDVDLATVAEEVSARLRALDAPLKVAVMGCVVNGPGESKHANIGISLPGTFEEPKAPVYVDGEHFRTLKGDGLVEEFKGILEEYVARRYGSEEQRDQDG
jgi:(E)-4-hydroxy-3-methylbut-2-enyl-diphosphate synthase